MVYYHTYNENVLDILAVLDPTGNQQDCLGMTPLHILTCSSVHDIEMYRLIVEKYPTNLITKDRWGAVPLLYAFWGVHNHGILCEIQEKLAYFESKHLRLMEATTILELGEL